MAKMICAAKWMSIFLGISYSCMVLAADTNDMTPAAVTQQASSADTQQAPPTEAEFRQWLNNIKQSAGAKTQAVSAPVTAPKPANPAPLTYQQQQQVMLNSAPPNPFPTSPDQNTAFQQMLQQNMPLSPEQVVRLRQLIDANQRAAAVPANIPPKPVSSSLMVNSAPGSTPPAIRLAQGYVTSVVFVDSTGQPWPISTFDIGDPKSVSVQWSGKGDKSNKNNVMLIQAVSPYSDGNMVVSLKGLATPITLELVAGQREVDYRVDVHVPGIVGADGTDLPTGAQLPNSADSVLLNILQGVPPSSSKALTVKGGACQAWLAGDTLYLRTRLTVLSPAWISRMVSSDGMFAYQMPKVPQVLASDDGSNIQLNIEGF